MSQEAQKVAPASTPAAAPAAERPIPKNLPIELLPLYDWWQANGGQLLITVLVAAVLCGGAFAYQQYRAGRSLGANKGVVEANTLEELESLVQKYGSTRAGNAARLRLAKAYYDASNFEESLAAYDACLRKGAPKGFAEVAQLGRAHALEGLNRLDEALSAFQTFDKGQEGHFLQPQAKMGVARILTLQGKKDEAKKILENLKAQKTDNPTWEMTVANLEGVVNRYEARASRSLFDAADAAAKQPPAKDQAPQAPAPAAAPTAK
jgi:predicted negative regulator of RcsB-dependent stress response